MGISAIPFESISSYAHRYEIDGEEFDEFLDVMLSLDDVQLKHEIAKQPKPKKK